MTELERDKTIRRNQDKYKIGNLFQNGQDVDFFPTSRVCEMMNASMLHFPFFERQISHF